MGNHPANGPASRPPEHELSGLIRSHFPGSVQGDPPTAQEVVQTLEDAAETPIRPPTVQKRGPVE